MRARPVPRRPARPRSLPVAILGSLLVAGCAPPEPEYRPSILVLVIDALRADRLGINGYPLPTTPNIDALAAESANFRTAIAHSTWTKPSIATLMTSLYPSQHGIHRVADGPEDELRTDVLHEGLVTLAERLQQGGYATGGSVNQVHLQKRFGFAQGFDFYNDRRGRNAFRLNRDLAGWLETLPAGQPFFAYLHYLDLHWPFTLRLPENEGAFGPTEMKNTPPAGGRQVPAWGAELDDEDDLRALIARYDHEVAYTDAGVGDLVERLKSAGLYEDTLLIITSDHGEAFLEHDQMGHAFAPHEELVRVPLVLRQPLAMRRVSGPIDDLVGLIDLMPTLLEIAGLEPEPAAEGRSFAPLLRPRQLGERALFMETYDAIAARTATHKLIRYAGGGHEAYDLVADPGEQHSLDGSCGAPCSELNEQLVEFRARMLASVFAADPDSVELTEEEIEELRALGYLN